MRFAGAFFFVVYTMRQGLVKEGWCFMAELNIAAKTEKLNEVISFVEEQLEAVNCPPKIMMQISVAVEEIFVNIAHYAYAPGEGMADIIFELSDDNAVVRISFSDSGIPYNPLNNHEPDITLSAEDRQIGGLGVFMVKKSMDNVEYEYLDGHNILTIEKSLTVK